MMVGVFKTPYSYILLFTRKQNQSENKNTIGGSVTSNISLSKSKSIEWLIERPRADIGIQMDILKGANSSLFFSFYRF